MISADKVSGKASVRVSFLERALTLGRVANHGVKELVKVGAFGIIEPLGDEIDCNIIDFIIVPGVAFDRNLNRLGRGKGYYDRLLSESNAFFAGIGYQMQVLEKIPVEDHDIKMNCIITEREIL